MPPPRTQPSVIGILHSASLTFLAIFLASVILRVMPPKLWDPLWQVSLTTALIDMGGYALLGVVLLAVAQRLASEDGLLASQMKRLAGLSRFAALGYLFLIPLLVSALLRDFQQVETLSRQQQRAIVEQERRVELAMRSARNRRELLRSVAMANTPALGGFLLDDVPLESQRNQALNLLKSTAASARKQAAGIGPGSIFSVLLNNLRLIALSLVFAFGFSSISTACPSFPLLQPLVFRHRERIARRPSRPPFGPQDSAERSYLESLVNDVDSDQQG